MEPPVELPGRAHAWGARVNPVHERSWKTNILVDYLNHRREQNGGEAKDARAREEYHQRAADGAAESHSGCVVVVEPGGPWNDKILK